MAYVKLYEEFIAEGSTYAEKRRDISLKVSQLATKKADLNAKIKKLQSQMDTPAEAIKAEIARTQLQLIEIDKQRAIISQKILDLNAKLAYFNR